MSQSESLRIIILDDSVSDSLLIEKELRKLCSTFTLKRVTSLEDLKTELEVRSWDLVLSELEGERFTVNEALKITLALAPDTSFVIVTDEMRGEDVVDYIHAGVKDIVCKDRPSRILPVVKAQLHHSHTRSEERKAQKLAEDALASKEQMLAIVSHDIKNPLFAIQLEAQMLLRASERNGKSLLSEEVKIQANRILKTTERMKFLITDLLDKNKSENSLSHLTKKDTNLLKVLNDALDSLRPLLQRKDIALRIQVPEEEVILSIDRNKMFQVFANLLNNAIKFTPEGGTIQVEVTETSQDCVFCMTDSGPGLSKNDLKRVFEKYWTSDVESHGTGLGLFICKTIIEAHQGLISVENSPGGGASFRFRLPKTNALLRDAHFSYYNPDRRKKIYIVDDDEDLREVISWALGKEGHAIYSFQSPQEALDCLNLERHRPPHLIVVDFHMDEMKGSEFVMRKNGISGARDCPVVMISASPQEVEQHLPRGDYEEVITKPIDLEGLVQNINKYLV